MASKGSSVKIPSQGGNVRLDPNDMLTIYFIEDSVSLTGNVNILVLTTPRQGTEIALGILKEAIDLNGMSFTFLGYTLTQEELDRGGIIRALWTGTNWIHERVGLFETGNPGSDGREIEMDFVDDYVVWRYVGDPDWIQLYSIFDAGVSVANSITGEGSLAVPLQLIGDIDTPGNNYYYGTDATGTKSWYLLPVGTDESGNTIINGDVILTEYGGGTHIGGATYLIGVDQDGNLVEINISVSETGQITFNDYGDGTYLTDLGDATYILAVDQDGNIIEISIDDLIAVTVTDSITGSGLASDPLKLVGDTATPGTTKYYGTNAGGDRGWYDFTTDNLAINVTRSIVGAATVDSPLMLSGDMVSPGAKRYYGTNSDGDKGWWGFTIDLMEIESEMSVAGTGASDDKLRLVNDSSTPGNYKFYGTNDSGVKGFYSIPSEGLSLVVDHSVSGAGTVASPIMLLNDADSPGVSRYYGTNAAGTKGWHSFDGNPVTENYWGRSGYILSPKTSNDILSVTTSNNAAAITGFSVSKSGLVGLSTNYYAIAGEGRFGAYFSGTTSGVTIDAKDPATNTIQDGLIIRRYSTTGDVGLGINMSFQLQSSEPVGEMASIKAILRDKTLNDQAVDLDFYTTTAGSQARVFGLVGETGGVILDYYGIGDFEDTPVYLLGVNANGNLVETTGGGITSILTTNSVTGTGVTGDEIKLSGDSNAPGNSKYYGTDGSGTKGFYDIPTLTLTDDVLDFSTNKYTPYTSVQTGKFYQHTDAPTGTTDLKYGGVFNATKYRATSVEVITPEVIKQQVSYTYDFPTYGLTNIPIVSFTTHYRLAFTPLIKVWNPVGYDGVTARPSINIGYGAGDNAYWGSSSIFHGASAGSGSTCDKLGTQGLAAGGASIIAIGFRSAYELEYDNTYVNEAGEATEERSIITIGYQAGESGTSIWNTIAIGYHSGYSSMLHNTVSLGAKALKSGSVQRTVAIGNNAGYQAVSVNSVFVGYGASYTNSANYVTSIGFQALYGSGADNNTVVGYKSGYASDGTNNTAFGYMSLYSYDDSSVSNVVTQGVNGTYIGPYSGYGVKYHDNNTGVGYNSMRYTNWPNQTRIGANSGTYFYDGVEESFDHTNIGDDGSYAINITIPHHGFGSTGEKVWLRFSVITGSSPAHGLVDGEYYLFYINGANQIARGMGTLTGLTGTYTLTKDADSTNSSAIGYNALPEKANQVMLGNEDVTEVKTYGGIYTCLQNVFESYGIGTYEEAPAYLLAVNASGEVIEVDPADVGGPGGDLYWSRAGTELTTATAGDTVSLTSTYNNYTLKAANTAYYGIWGVSSSSSGVHGTSTTGAGVSGTSEYIGVSAAGTASGTGLNASAVTGYAVYAYINPATTTGGSIIAMFNRRTSGTAQNDISGCIDITIENGSGSQKSAVQLYGVLTDVTNTTEDGAFDIHVRNDGSLARKLRIDSLGRLTLDYYGSGSATGTAAKMLAVTSSGLVIEETLPSVGTNYWQRNTTTVSPATSGDRLEVTANDSNGSIKGISTDYDGVVGTSTVIGYSGVKGQNNAGTGVTGAGIVGIYGQSSGTNNVGGSFFSTDGIGLHTQVNSSTTNTLLEVMRIERSTTGTAAANIGTGVGLYAETDSGGLQELGSYGMKWTTVAALTRVSAFELYLVDAASKARKLAVSGAGKMTLDTYGSGTHTGTATKMLAVDASGNVIEETLPAASTNYWTRTGNELSPSNAGDNIKYSANDSDASLNVTSTDYTSIYGESTSGIGVYGKSNSNHALYGVSTTGLGLYAQSSGTLAGRILLDLSSTNTVVAALSVARQTTGTAAAGIGVRIQMDAENAASPTPRLRSVAFLDASFTDVTNNAEKGKLAIKIADATNSGDPVEMMNIIDTGLVQFNKYGDGTFTGTETYTLSVDTDGKIIEKARLGSGAKASSTDAGYTGEMSFSGNDLYLCTVGGTAGNATWVKFTGTGV